MTRRRRRRRLRGEEGASLLLALAFLVLFSAVSVSVLSLGSVSFKNTGVARSRVQQQYAADGGVEYGIRKLATSASEYCPAFSSTPSTVGTTTLNGKQVTVTCRTTDGGTTSISGSPLLGGYVAVIGGGGITQTGDGWGTSQIHGNLYSGGSIIPGSGVLGVARNISVVGNLKMAQAPCPPAQVTATSCAVVPSAPTVATPSVVIPTTSAPTPTSNGTNCTILYPGKYTSMPTFDASKRYYLASGTYYFVGSSDVTLKGQVFGGSPSTGPPWNDAQKITGVPPCATDAIAQQKLSSYDATKAGTGVTIVRGGIGKFRIENDASKVELYTRVPAATSADAAATPGVTFWANTTTTGAGSSYTPVSANADVFVTTARDAEVVLHGLSYMANSYANLREPFNEETTTPGQVSFFLGGLAARKLSVVRVFDWTYPPISLAGTGEDTVVTTNRTTILTATAGGTDGGAATTVTAVVKPDESSGPEILSWREGE